MKGFGRTMPVNLHPSSLISPARGAMRGAFNEEH